MVASLMQIQAADLNRDIIEAIEKTNIAKVRRTLRSGLIVTKNEHIKTRELARLAREKSEHALAQVSVANNAETISRKTGGLIDVAIGMTGIYLGARWAIDSIRNDIELGHILFFGALGIIPGAIALGFGISEINKGFTNYDAKARLTRSLAIEALTRRMPVTK